MVKYLEGQLPLGPRLPLTATPGTRRVRSDVLGGRAQPLGRLQELALKPRGGAKAGGVGLPCIVKWPFLFLVLPQATVSRYTRKMAQVPVHLQAMLLRKEGGRSVSGSSPSHPA